MPGVVWNINTVLDYIKTLPSNSTMSLMQLSQKLAFLLLICTTRRRSDIMAVHLNYITRDANRYVCHLQALSKMYSTRNNSCQLLEILRFPSDKWVCPYNTLAWYLYRTKTVRTDCRWLFVTTTTGSEAAPATFSRWVKTFMCNAGIDIAKFTPHSCCAAGSSFLLSLNVPLDGITRKGCWQTTSTFKTF